MRHIAKKAKAANGNLHAARKAKNDEFYTQLADIENELKHYKKHFKNKVVLCNCDDPLESNFVKYFILNFEHLGLKKLIATHYKESNLFQQEPPYKLEYTGDKDGDKVPDPEEFVTEMLDDGDFRSPECEDLLEEADIVVTNPPFSLFRDYVGQLMLFEKEFLVLGSINAITYKETFKLIKENKLWLGFTHPKKFTLPNGEVKILGNICWYTNLSRTKRSEKLTLYKKYSPKEYPKYDNYDAINVDRVADIPMDYEGVMGVPITFMDKHNPEQFEVLDLSPHFFDMVEQGLPKPKQLQLSGHKDPYVRILVRNRKPQK
jgi:hypothetical protein